MLKKCSNCFKSLGVSSRMKIYDYLVVHGGATVSDIVSMLQLTQPTVSYHLHQMQENGLLASQKQGKEVYYSINESCPVDTKTCVLCQIEEIYVKNQKPES